MSDRYSKLDQLGQQNPLPKSPDEAVLERVKNPCSEPYMVRLVAPEFTSICPVTGQPDFAHLVVDYCPDKWIRPVLANVSLRRLAQNGCESADIGIREGVFRLMCFTNSGRHQRVYGFQNKAFRPIEDADKTTVLK